MNRTAKMFAAALCVATGTAMAIDNPVTADYTLTGDETVSGTLAIARGVTVNLDGHNLTVGGLAGSAGGNVGENGRYQLLEYVTATGTQSVMTDYTPNMSDHVEMKVQFNDLSSGNGLCCSRSSSNAYSYMLMTYSNRIDYRHGADKQTYAYYGLTTGKDYVISMDGSSGVGTCKDLTSGTTSSRAITLDSGFREGCGPFCLLNIGSYASVGSSFTQGSYYAKCKFYYFKVYGENGNIVCWIVPALDTTTSTVGLYNLVSGTFLEPNNALTGDGTYSDGGSIVNTSSTTGALRFNVAEGTTVENDSVTIAGNVKVVNAGDGSLVLSKPHQTYYGGTDIEAGTIKCGLPGRLRPAGGGSENLILNGDFEEASISDNFATSSTVIWPENPHWSCDGGGIAGITKSNNTTWLPSGVDVGSYALFMRTQANGADGYARQSFYVPSAGNYHVRFAYIACSASGRSGGTMKASLFHGSTTDVLFSGAVSATYKNYYNGTVTVSEPGMYTIEFRQVAGNKVLACNIDDVSFTRDINLIKNGDFEQATISDSHKYATGTDWSACPYWTCDGVNVGLSKANNVWITSGVNVGTYAAYLRTPSDAHFEQTVAIADPGAYKIRFGYMACHNSGRRGEPVVVRLIHGGVTNVVATITATAVNKNYFETIVDIPEAGDYTLQFFQTTTTTPKEAWSSSIDDVSFSRVPGITVDAGGTIDMYGQTEYQDYSFVMNGGTFDNTGTRATYSGKSMVSRMLLTADSVFAPTKSYGFSCYLDGTYYETFLNLGGHELKAQLTSDNMYMSNCTMTNGTLSVATNCVDATGNITFIGAASSACDVDLYFDITCRMYVGIDGIRNLSLGEKAYDDIGSGSISVSGTFSTLSTRFGNTVLGDGATLDLSGISGTLSVTSTSGRGQTISFPDGGAVTVDAGARALSDGMQLLSWTETEVSDITTAFTLDYDGKPAEDPEFNASVRSDGLYVVYSGTPAYARISLGGEEPTWVFYDANDNQVTTWEGGVTSDMAVRFSSYAEYTAIAERASGISPTEYVLDGNFALPDETGTADMTGLSFRCEEGVTIDVKGQTLAFPYTMFSRAEAITITSSVEGGVLTVEVPESVTVNNSAVSLTGSLRFCLEGNPNSGRFYAAKADQAYTGGTEISSGLLYGAASGCLGPAGSEVIVDTDGRMDLNGLRTIYKDYDFVLNGGTLQNTISDIASDVLDVTSVQLAADSSFAAVKNWGLVGENYEDVSLDLGGHTLEIRVYSGQWFFIYADEIKNGTISAMTGGWLRIAQPGREFTDPINATNVDFVVNTALEVNRSVDVRNYEAVYNANYNRGSYQFNVHGKFKPSAHDYFRGCEMQDGSTLDLSARTNACPVVSSFSNGEKTLIFAENANVTVNLDGRTDLRALVKSEDARIVSWESATAPASSVKFKIGGEMRSAYSLRVGDDGLYLCSGGTYIIIR